MIRNVKSERCRHDAVPEIRSFRGSRSPPLRCFFCSLLLLFFSFLFFSGVTVVHARKGARKTATALLLFSCQISSDRTVISMLLAACRNRFVPFFFSVTRQPDCRPPTLRGYGPTRLTGCSRNDDASIWWQTSQTERRPKVTDDERH